MGNINKYRIAIVSNTSWSIFNFRLGLIRQLRDSGYEVIIIAPKDEFSAKLIAEGFKYLHIDFDNYGINPLNDLKSISQLTKIYQKHSPHFIFHYTIKPNIYGSFAAWGCGIPSIAITTGLGHLFTFKNSLIRFITIWLYRIAAEISKEVWFLNEPDRALFLKKRIISSKKAKLLPSEGIDLNWFKPVKQSINIKSNKIHFLFAGRLLGDKGIFDYVEAARIIKSKYINIEFEILGFINPENSNSVSSEQIQKWQSENIITYLGETDDIRPYILSCDCLIFPSFYGEGISRILLEAAALGKPIITTDNTGCRDVILNGITGFLSKPRDINDLVIQIERFISLKPEDRILMGKAARTNVEQKFDEQHIIAQYFQTLQCYLPQNHQKITVS